MTQRYCLKRGCRTRVSKYNRDRYCWTHQREVMSTKFLGNVRSTYTLSAEDKRYLREVNKRGDVSKSQP